MVLVLLVCYKFRWQLKLALAKFIVKIYKMEVFVELDFLSVFNNLNHLEQ